jgi:hypothetical protein
MARAHRRQADAPGESGAGECDERESEESCSKTTRAVHESSSATPGLRIGRIHARRRHWDGSKWGPETRHRPSGRRRTELLRQFKEEWNSHHQTVPRDLAHLFTRIKPNDGIVGKSSGAEVWWNPSDAYSFTFVYESAFNVTVHEFGHDFGLTHYCTSCDCPTCASTDAPVMCPCTRNPNTLEYQDHDGCELRNYVRRFAPGGPLLRNARADGGPANAGSVADALRCGP